ncbi:hypothetical protein [Vibrio phage V-YDF132]|nr:hypothetical protein [Vibrio phage V-YDF132]
MTTMPTRKKKHHVVRDTSRPRTNLEGKSLAEVAKSRKGESIEQRRQKKYPPKETLPDASEQRTRKNASTPEKLRERFGLTEEQCAELGKEDLWIPEAGQWSGQYEVLSITGQVALCRCICGGIEDIHLSKLQESPSCRHVDSPEKGMASNANKTMYRRWKRLMHQTLRDPDSVSREWRSAQTFIREAREGEFPHAVLVRLDDTKTWGKGNTIWMTRALHHSIEGWMYTKVAYAGELRTIFQLLVLIEADLKRCSTHYKRNRSVEMMWAWAKKEFAK